MQTVFQLPQMSMTMVDGVVTAWHKNVGDFVKANEPLLEVETDKMAKDLTSPVDGYLVSIAAAVDDIVPVGGELCRLADQMDESSKPAVQKSEEPAEPEKAAAPAPAAYRPSDAKQRISPLARRIAAMEGLSTEGIAGSGPGGTVVKRDIEAALAKRKVSKAPAAPEQTAKTEDKLIPLHGIRKAIAENMMLSRQNTAMLTTVAEVDLTKLAACRKFVHLSYTTYAVAAVAHALQEERFEMMRSQLEGDVIHVKQDININVSVATGRSLVTPVIRNADRKDIFQLGRELKDLSTKAREQALDADAFQGGCFTITNSGVFGSLFYTPLINYPQSAILGMGKIMDTPVARDGQVVLAPKMYICLSYDHRLIDGETGAPFLQRVKYFLENPEEMLDAADEQKGS